MDPSTRLDHAVFQLTPTRTRCDLLVCSSSGKGGGVYEKIASGLLDPFLSHLRCAREQIPKGGYSFTLRPPHQSTAAARSGSPSSAATGDAAAGSTNWFTKGTLERFVRFVSSPEILERVAAIEKEIVHIESCIHQAEDDQPTATTTVSPGGTAKADNQLISHGAGDDNNSRKLSPPSKVKAEGNGHDATHVHGEKSKHCLQQTLETRKAVLLKEQGMAYARATVAGYDMPNVDDLVSFADTFGAFRLREACMNFKDICEKKEKDKIWMDELAAIVAPSAIMLEAVNGHHSELSGTLSDTVTDPTVAAASSDAGQDNNGNTPTRELWTSANNSIYHEKFQIPIGWPSHPPYMYNFQNPAHQMPPYQGYAFPYPVGQFDSAENHSKPVKKKAGRNTTSGSRNGERSHDSSKSESESDGQMQSDASQEEVLGKGRGHKRTNKKSSRTVVIRNINYISSERRDEEDGSTSGSSVQDDINEDFLKHKVENIVDSLKKHHKTSRHQHKRRGKNKTQRNIEDDDDDSDQDADINANAKDSGTKGDESWNAFQSILMRDESSSTELHEKNNVRPRGSNEQEQYHVYSRDGKTKNADLVTLSVFPLETESLKGTRQRADATDPVAANDKDGNYNDKNYSQNFDCDENYSTRMKRIHNVDEELLFSERTKSDHAMSDDITVYANETLTPNLQKDTDCFIISKSSSLQDGEQTGEYSMFEGDQNVKSLDRVNEQKITNELPVDDSFIIATRSTEDEQPISHWDTDMSIISGLAFSTEVEGVGVASHSTGYSIMSNNHEPDDLQMVLERNMGSEPLGASWAPEIDYTADITFHVAKENDSIHEENVSTESSNLKIASGNGTPRNKLPAKDAKSKPTYGYLTKAKPEVAPKNRKPSAPMSREEIQRNKMLKEEENRRRTEVLLAQRQKRIAERSSTGRTTENKLGVGPLKQEKKTPRPVPGSSRPSLLHRTEATSLAKNSHAPDQLKKNGKVAAVAM
ncbi:hypothetical protein Taro_012763 [Colocasia esculenta]|uniref:COP1-interacting protein 7 n=1 Tax=Colocasia esculenta TaxID=4460 RepID=A0A843UGN6_COLES|nr:hypothetical protein [Colocasia esculenta]